MIIDVQIKILSEKNIVFEASREREKGEVRWRPLLLIIHRMPGWPL
jgi:hypothetical protein